MKILCIGNSFSMDVATYVHQIAKSAGQDVDIYVLYIGGCPIKRHYKNFLSGEKEYEFYKNGGPTPLMWCSIHEGLAYEKWDYITFQQVSTDSCDADSFFPELTLLLEGVRKVTDATFILHKTWSYSKRHSHEKYGKNPMNQQKMSEDIEKAYEIVSSKTGIKYIIPSGTAITSARSVFGDDLNRDGYHLNERGRTLTGLLLAFYFLGKDIDVSSFRPNGYSYDDISGPISEKELPVLIDISKKTLMDNKEHNLNG